MTSNLAEAQYNIRHIQTFAADDTPKLVPHLVFCISIHYCTVIHKHLFFLVKYFFSFSTPKLYFELSK